MDPVLPYTPLFKILSIGALSGLCVAVHAAGLMVMSRWLRKGVERNKRSYWRDVWLMVRVSWGLVFLHVVEITIWGVFYTWKGLLPDLNTALYFSSITYSTVGYGDVILSTGWRLFSSAEALVGILMAGLSTSFFFMFLHQLFARQFDTGQTHRP
ncbi:MAG: potassium channel family protein [Flavobacteriales bacterium]